MTNNYSYKQIALVVAACGATALALQNISCDLYVFDFIGRITVIALLMYFARSVATNYEV